MQELDLVEEADKITHNCALDDELELDDDANIFQFDSNFAQKEQEWDEIRKEIVGDYFEQLEQPSEDEAKQSDENDEIVVSSVFLSD